ncbi:hypothetical protein SAMN05421720_10749 [Rhodospira trueperi]|uniref:Extracellular solute-binding protein, family 3 n=2 Tax=Rhodospira trueperi TaxID=69960 RepID=A0A1G7D5X3_9PROT|nr:hypothetical protein SAMN05421720_10749 [Rhodospira trueperi]
MVTERHGPVPRRERRTALALALALLIAAPGAGAATDPDAESAPEAEPLILCTAPWPPFVEAVPPLRPPASKPDPVALGFPARGDTATTAEPEDMAAPEIMPPPLPEPLRPEVGDSAPASPDTEGPPGAGTPVEVLPPPVPLNKRVARVELAVADAHRRAEASVDRSEAPAPESGPEDQPAGGEAAAAEAPETAVDAEVAEVDVAPPAVEEAEDGESAESAESAEDDADTGAMLSALQMPTARALMPRGHAGGPMSEAVRAACREGGLNCRVVLGPWIRPRTQLASGACDAVFPVEKAAGSAGFMTVSDAVVNSRLTFFTMNTTIHRMADMAEYIVLAQGPSDAAEDARAAIEALEKSALVLGPDLASLIRRLSGLEPTDRVALYGNYHVITDAMRDHEGPIPALNVIPHRRQALRVGFARATVPDAVVEAFNQGLKRIRETRELQDILDVGDVAPVN